jgi:hypothetical protein
MGASAYAVDRATSSFNPDEVVAKAVELLLNAGLSSFADGYYTDHRRYSDGDSKNGKDAPHFISE